ncbi:pyridoxal-phosphate dependent enzyme [Streptomyces sp. NBC_00083]|uniref:pyridoxal-phosphate dependent enzyme n=1 Tax=Streptomyces sp. NBC_00083 TaxID=2975647 RepID=UPI00225A3248|nr:pyridoxal-phosphate dependent enzyme [Streptomyces sp. NBC_00083]MCX5387049.1 pyridoxal-phosphate dependent enzyme [Streptomyces sp. NBC_00083]
MTSAPLLPADRPAAGTVPVPAGRPYLLRCPVCGEGYQDDGVRLDCAVAHRPALLRTEYATAFTPGPGGGPFRYRCWLPVGGRELPRGSGGATYRAERLGRVLGLSELWVAFSGYWPERGADLVTGSFKELEAQAVLARLPERPPVLVVASAGNTAAAFLRACSRQGVECVLVVPETALPALAAAGERADCVRLVTVAGDYGDAIEVADAIAARPGFQAEGGTRNVARRDGLGTALLNAAETIGRLPDHYVQAVGSGAGAIAAHEAARRLLASGMQGARWPAAGSGALWDRTATLPGRTDGGAARSGGLPRLTLCQNAAFAPMFHAWRDGLAEPVIGSGQEARAAVAAAYAQELTTRRPPYAVAGGVRDVLAESGGELCTADSSEASAAGRLFADVEGIDIEPAAAVALAGLRRAVAAGRIRPRETVLLHITGGGRARRAGGRPPVAVVPDLRVPAGLGVQDAAHLVTRA